MGRRAVRLPALVALGVSLLAPAATRAAGPPVIESTSVTEVTATSARLRATINPNGLLTSYRFEYISEAAFRANVEAEPPRDGFVAAAIAPPTGATKISGAPQSVVQIASPLVPATSYRYRVWVSNSAGTITGADHAFGTQESSLAFKLPDNRSWELVSPANKNGGSIQGPGQIFGGGLDQAAVQGGSLTFSAATAFGQAPGAPPASQYLSTRTTSGWVSQNVSTPLHSGAYGEEPDGVPYRLFSTDLAKGLLFGGQCRGEEVECAAANPPFPGSGAPAGYANFYLRDNATGAFNALLEGGDVAESSLGAKALPVSAVAATPDLSHVVISSCARLAPGAIEIPAADGCDPEATNLYEWSAAGIELLNLLPGQSEGTPGAQIAASLDAISGDGSRVYWSLGGNLYLREGNQSFQVDESPGGGGSFQTASAGGSIAYFTKAGHLYRYSAHTSTDLTPSGGVTGVLGASANGAYLYYQDASGLWLWHEGATTEVAEGADATLPSDYPPATGTARVTADGKHLTFLSNVSVTGYENAGQTEVFIYGPPVGGGEDELFCVSCNPTGETATGAATIPGAPPNGNLPLPYKPRALSADGSRVFFETGEHLAIQDTNTPADVYQWEAVGAGTCTRAPGCISLLSSGRSSGGATFLDASVDGSDVFFLTDGPLVGADVGSFDVYDARVNGGFAEAPKPISCTGDACQALPAPPEDPTPGTLTPGAGNQGLAIAKEKQKKKRHHRKRGVHKHHHHKGRGSR